MKPRQVSPTFEMYLKRRLPLLLAVMILATCVFDLRSSAQGQIQVTGADPVAGEQGTLSLNVRVTGKGFKNGAQAKWLVTGTNDTGGVTVNSTAFVSSTELTANITISDTAVIANFDIQVLASDGRGGKGTELFRVTAKGGGNGDCPPPPPAPTSDTKCYDLLPGCLDLTFGGIGIVHTDPDPGPYTNQANAVVIQPDDKIVVAAEARSATTGKDFALLRYNVDGSLDNTFGDPDPLNPALRRGFTVTTLSTGFDGTRDVALQPDGKFVVSGFANDSSNSVVVRYNVDGTLDNSFGNGGIFQLGPTHPSRRIALQSDGKIVIGGIAGGVNSFALTRLNPNGSLDLSFGSNGRVSVNPSGAKRGWGAGVDLAIQRVPAVTGEERIILVGGSALASNDNVDWTLMRFRSNGSVDTSFGSAGVVKTFFSGSGDAAQRILIDSNNRVMVAGNTTVNSTCGVYLSNLAVVRYTQDGNLDGSFSGGKQVLDIFGGQDGLYGLALQTDGKVLILGYGRSADGTQTHFALARFNVNGTRDLLFGPVGNGVVTTDLFGTSSWPFDLALQSSDGRIVAVGGSYTVPPSSEGHIFLARYWQ